MNYALIENNIVTNIIWLYPKNVSDFPNAVPMNDIPVAIGDEYIDGIFYRNGERILTEVEQLQKQNTEKDEVIAELDATIINMAYQNIIEGVE